MDFRLRQGQLYFITCVGIFINAVPLYFCMKGKKFTKELTLAPTVSTIDKGGHCRNVNLGIKLKSNNFLHKI